MRVILIFLFLVSIHTSFAQGNLQFNQVITYAFASSNTTPITVPAGKVWKLENCMLNSVSNTYTYMLYNGVYYNLRQQLTSSQVANFPFWLSAGTSVTFGSAGGAAGGILSIIEFNIIP
ncbi:MAG: hypothetical protein K9I37_06105 [Crocinitomicaceae bacterium]|jgi:hypothetical protein|nr:hypothetical protein [Crocinitomicaceae bacterium]